MFDIGFSELVLCAVVALVVFGPEKLPTLLRDIGAFRRQVSQLWQHAQHSLQKELDAATAEKPQEPRS
ncbi:Sec-independent protein translocase protein TatB [Tolumonas lignilytica]|uniref:Sec-independent protein translocase protein TatB n=1 Tax=Tolumonas lignilytica TaxID=1283284 RepID=UPI0004B52E20|nr:Sec-independent protein translocase protein TatB [Tolumonas lignilytica]